MKSSLFKHPSAFVPVAMSIVALAVVVVALTMFGATRQSDEGAAAHLWQLLMAGQVPVIVYFLIRWLPSDPKATLGVLALQLGAALAAMFPVWWFHL